MRWLLLAAAVLGLAVPALGQETSINGSNPLSKLSGIDAGTVEGSASWSFQTVKPSNFNIICGTGGMVSIALADGSVTYSGGCNPDDAARAFWSAVSRLAPMKVEGAK